MRGLVEYSSSSDDEGGSAAAADTATPAAANPAASPPRPPPRVRSFPHVAGQFAVHTHVPVEVGADLADRLRGVAARLAPAVPGLTLADALRVPGRAQAPTASAATAAATAAPLPPHPTLHLSLSRVAPLASRNVPALTDGLAATLTEAVGLPAAGFGLALAALAALENDDGTQCFLAAAPVRGGDGSPSLAAFTATVAAVDAAGALVGLPPFYRHPAPHVSFAWAPGGSAAALRAAVADTPWPGPAWDLPVRRVACRVGKRVVTVWRSSSGGGGG